MGRTYSPPNRQKNLHRITKKFELNVVVLLHKCYQITSPCAWRLLSLFCFKPWNVFWVAISCHTSTDIHHNNKPGGIQNVVF